MHASDYCIIVAEDDELLRYCTVRLLRDHGYKVIEAADGQQAVDLLEKCDDPVHLLVTNYNMPNLNGLDLARRLRIKHEALTVLLISGDPPATDASEGIEVMAKPYNQAELTTKVRELLRRSALTQNSNRH